MNNEFNSSRKIMLLACCCFAFCSGHVFNRYNDLNSRTPIALHRYNQTKWFTHGEEIINGTEFYGFDTSNQFNSSTPDHTTTYAAYSGGVTNMVAVNESSFYPYGYDSTSQRFDFTCRYSLGSSAEIIANGAAHVGVSYSPYLPGNCEICYDSRALGDAAPFWQLADGESPVIANGILLHRSNSTGNFTTWDGYVYLDAFIENPNLRLYFGANQVVQIAILYEIHNYDNGWWIFQNHRYYHNIGIYCFETA